MFTKQHLSYLVLLTLTSTIMLTCAIYSHRSFAGTSEAKSTLLHSQQPTKSPRSPRKTGDGTLESPPKSPQATRPGAFTLTGLLPSPKQRPDQDDIASSFSKLLQLMSRKDSEPATENSPSKIAKPSQAKPTKCSLTPDHKQSALAKSANRDRPASADSKSRSWRQRGVNAPKTTSLATKGGQQASKASGSTHQREPVDTTSTNKASDLQDVAKTEFAESSFVYFSCHEEPPVDHEQQAWSMNERVQVARFVRSLPSGDCLVQLLKADATYSQATTGALGFKAYVSTPHFIECCGSQLHNIHSMKFDAAMGKWKWYSQQLNGGDNGGDGSSALWKRDLAIDIVPSVYTLPAGPKTEPALKSRSLIPTAAMAKKDVPERALLH